MSSRNWSASETRTLEPFLRADSVLDEVQFRCEPSRDFSREPKYWFEADALPEVLEPELFLDVDPDFVADHVGIPAEDLRLVVIVRDRAVARWEVVDTWPLVEIPDLEYVLPTLDDNSFAMGRRMEVSVIVTPASVLPAEEGRAHLPTHVVASRSFEMAVRRDGARFNVAVMEPEWFVEHGMARDTVWAIDWQSRDVEREPIACLTVVVNQSHEAKLQAALSGSSANAVATLIAVDVFVEVAMTTLAAATDYTDEPSTLLGTVLRNLGIGSEDEYALLKQRLLDEGDRATLLSVIRGRMQSRLGLAKQLG
jgi:hypothetical protein